MSMNESKENQPPEEDGSLNAPSNRAGFAAIFSSRLFGLGLALVSLVFISCYVFFFTNYQDFLYSDMGGFWWRAIERLKGNTFQITQYWAWPPGYHIFLAELFRVFLWLGLESLIRPETPLMINILLYSASVYALHRISVRWFKKPLWGAITVGVYIFGFPAWYLNAFLLSGNLALPLLVMAACLLYCREDWLSIILAAVLFALASFVRPSVAPFGLAFVIYFLIRWRLSWAFIARAAVFSAVFFALIALGMAEVSRISEGRVSGLSANGGLDFMLSNSRHHRVDMFYQGYHCTIGLPALAFKPEKGYFKTNVPFWDQAYYYRLGWEHIRHNPSRLIKNFEHVWDLFFSPMLPSRETPGYKFFRPAWDIFKFLMFLSMGLYLWFARRLLPEDRPLFGFLMSVMGLTLLVSYLFSGEPRYAYAIIFVFYLLFFKLAELLFANFKRWIKVLLIYAVGVALAAVGIVAIVYWLDAYPATMRMEVRPLATAPGGEVKLTQDISRLFFPFARLGGIAHHETGYRLEDAVRVSARTEMDIAGSVPLRMDFDIVSTWPFVVLIDGQPLIADENPYYIDGPKAPPDADKGLERKAFITLKPGRHTLELVFDFDRLEGGYAINYNYPGPDGWLHRKMVGVNSGPVSFHLPKGAAP